MPLSADPTTLAVEKTFRLSTARQRRWAAAFLALCSTSTSVIAFVYLFQVGDLRTAAWAAVGMTLLSSFLLFQDMEIVLAIRIAALRVVVSPAALTTYNLGGVFHVKRAAIDRIELRSHSAGRGIPTWTPLVWLKDGTAFWLDALSRGREYEPPKPEQLAAADEIRSELGLEGPLVQSTKPPFPYGEWRLARPDFALPGGKRAARAWRTGAYAKAVLIAGLIAGVVGTGPRHHLVVGILGGVGYLILGTAFARLLLRTRTSSSSVA